MKKRNWWSGWRRRKSGLIEEGEGEEEEELQEVREREEGGEGGGSDCVVCFRS